MKKILASLIAASVALISAQAFAQEASGAAAAAPAATEAASAPVKTTKAKKQHKKLKHHGKRAPVQEAASAAGTSGKGAAN